MRTLRFNRRDLRQRTFLSGWTVASASTFAPGMEHCLIGADDLLVYERGTDPEGMDQDLIFLYEPDGA